ncbi:MAG TPA: hypothetical protein VHE80_09285 [Acidimicrobiales bacterium]|nr:hypothetical protein [Acidimicrobiales bacterium]
MATGVGRRLSGRARQITEAGAGAFTPVPTPEELSQRSDADRYELLDGLRLELYAICSIAADATLQRARREGPSYPPYGLVRSGHTATRMVLADPGPVEEGSVDSFHALGKAYIDTLVFHLHRVLGDELRADRRFLLQRLEELLRLFRVPAGPVGRSRMRDGVSFLYGGLQFGASVCVQFTEVMARLLQPHPELTADDRAKVIARSSRPAHQLAALNADHVVFAYHHLQSPVDGAATAPPGWMEAAHFEVHEVDGAPWRVEFRHEEPFGPKVRDVPATYTTLGCPARTSPAGGPSAITAMWSWCVELAHDTGLLAPAVP